MFKNYIKIAWRNILKNKVYSFINIGGLAIGIAASLLIIQYVFFERSYETFHDKKDRIYRITQDRYDKGVLTNQWAAGAYAAGNSFAAEIPEIESYVKVIDEGNVIVDINNIPIKIEKTYWASSSFFTIFSYPLIYGDDSTALSDPSSLAISASTSELLFNTTNSIGRTLEINGELTFQVSAVYEDMPANTQLRPNIIMPYANFVRDREYAETAWTWDGCLSYVLLHEGVDPKVVEGKFSAIVDNGVGETLRQFNSSVTYNLQPIVDIHLHSNLMMEPALNGDTKIVNLLMGIAFFILLIAWINYINLATARAIGRAKKSVLEKPSAPRDHN